MKRKSNLRFFIAFPLASAIAALLAMSPRLHAAPYTWTQNTAAPQTWTTPGNWASSTEFVSAPGNELIFIANTTAALASGINDITGSVPGSARSTA